MCVCKRKTKRHTRVYPYHWSFSKSYPCVQENLINSTDYTCLVNAGITYKMICQFRCKMKLLMYRMTLAWIKILYQDVNWMQHHREETLCIIIMTQQEPYSINIFPLFVEGLAIPSSMELNFLKLQVQLSRRSRMINSRWFRNRQLTTKEFLSTYHIVWHLPCLQTYGRHAAKITQGPLPIALHFRKYSYISSHFKHCKKAFSSKDKDLQMHDVILIQLPTLPVSGMSC